jgi:hypothetical protein
MTRPFEQNDAVEITQPVPQIKKPEIKPGYKTTEFYKSLVLEAVGLAAAFGLISPAHTTILNQVPDAIQLTADTVVKVAGIMTALISQWSYTKSRAFAKQQPAKTN